ncbi:MAG: ATPase, T2SS/T4P/T4SS family [Moorellales bacterium]
MVRTAKGRENGEPRVVDLKQATRLVQETIQDPSVVGEETAARNKEILEAAMAGVPGFRSRAVEAVKAVLELHGVEVEGMDLDAASYEIYKYAWGLDVIEDLYRDPEVNEIRVNAPDRVYVLRRLKNERTDVRFRDDEHVLKIITRITMHDRGVSLNRSSPTLESVRKDGTRVTATCPPVTEHVTLVLRKHIPRALTPEEMIASGVFDEKVWEVLRALVRGRANILVCGGVGSGKTTLVRTLYRETHENARCVALESDRELFLAKNFPERDIVEMEEHPETGRTLASLFRTVLRYSPTFIVVGEYRSAEEAKEAIEACRRGHDGSMATAHFNSPEEAVVGTARLYVESGAGVRPEAAAQAVASAYNVVVQMFGDPTRGVLKLERIAEVAPDGDRGAAINDLVRWTPRGEDYLDGDWKIVGSPGRRLAERLARYGSSLPGWLKC